MKKQSWKFIGAVCIAVVCTLILISINVNAQNQSIELLKERFIQYKVPVKDVSLIRRIPFEVEIVLRSTSTDNQASLDDLWNTQLVRREASMAYTLGMKIDNYKIVFIDDNNKVITWEKNFLNPDQASQKIKDTAIAPRIDNATAKLSIYSALNFSGTNVDLFDIEFDALSKRNQILIIQLSIPNLVTANNLLPNIILSLRNAIDEVNSEKGARVVLCRMRVIDKDGNILLNYVWDSETREETSTSVKGMSPWYPRPRPTDMPSNFFTQTPVPYPAPSSKASPQKTPAGYPVP